MSRTTYLTPLPGLLPGCVSLAMICDLVRSLPRPGPGGPPGQAPGSRPPGQAPGGRPPGQAPGDRPPGQVPGGRPPGYARQFLQDALGMLDAYGPRDALEAALAVQIVILHCRARRATELAMEGADEPAQMLRAERHAEALLRCAAALERRLYRHRKELAAEGLVHVAAPQWECDLDALEALWRGEPWGDSTGVRPGSAPTPPEVLAAEALAAAARVPLWKKAGREYLDELTDEELFEVIGAQERGEAIEEPPLRPDHIPMPPDRTVKLTEEQIAAMTPAQRWQRYGCWTERPE